MVGATAQSVQGAVRKKNQDACCVQVAQTPWGALSMAIVCDGVGGLSLGELASAHVIRRFATWFSHDLPLVLNVRGQDFSVERLDVTWDELLHELHNELATMGGNEGVRMGTTFTGVLAFRGRYLACQVGDSRLYVVGEQGLQQITEDQTLVAKLLAEGSISAQEAAKHPEKNVILQAVGVGEELQPHFTVGSYAPQHTFLLCTDGVHGCLSNEDLHSCVVAYDAQKASLESCCEELVRRALEAGSKDNVSAVCLRGDPLRALESQTLVVGEGSW